MQTPDIPILFFSGSWQHNNIPTDTDAWSDMLSTPVGDIFLERSIMNPRTVYIYSRIENDYEIIAVVHLQEE